MESRILAEAASHVQGLFEKFLPEDRRFHNFQHTLMVVKGVRDIIAHLAISDENKEIAELAAWFHDAGHIIAYVGHEEESKKLAKAFLESQQYPAHKIKKIIETIEGTEMPQEPHDELQRILCDADLFHLAQPEYQHLAEHLRIEWRLALHKDYSKGQWKEENLSFLMRHQYFTAYGKKVLQKKKEDNIKKLKKCSSP